MRAYTRTRVYVCVRVHVTRTCAYAREYVREYVRTRLNSDAIPLVPSLLYRHCLPLIASATGLCVRAMASAMRCCCETLQLSLAVTVNRSGSSIPLGTLNRVNLARLSR